jgi:hypothetical protein
LPQMVGKIVKEFSDILNTWIIGFRTLKKLE